MSDHYKHISEKAARKASDELARAKATQRAEARAKLVQVAQGKTELDGAGLSAAIPASANQSAMLQ
jgi:hypothetical protein